MRNLDGDFQMGVVALTETSDFLLKNLNMEEKKNYQVFVDEFESIDEKTLFEEVKEEQAYEFECK